MPNETKRTFAWLTVAILVAQILYIVGFILLLIVLFQGLNAGSVSASAATVFVLLYIVVMVGANIAWRLLVRKKHIIFAVITVIIAVVINIALAEFFTLQNAHSSFDNYYKFRGCTETVSRSDTSGLCNLPSGETIKIVESHNKWYLDGDLPNGWF